MYLTCRCHVIILLCSVLFHIFKINAEFLRITTVPLQTRFLASLDNHHIKLIELFRRKGGVIREKTQKILKVLDLVCTPVLCIDRSRFICMPIL